MPSSKPERKEEVERFLCVCDSPGVLFSAFDVNVLQAFARQSLRLEDVTFDDAFPTLDTVSCAFSEEVALVWLEECFSSFTEMWSPSKDRNQRLLTRLAGIVLAEGRQLNLGEVCLFIAWLTSGKMGNLYDASPVRIACCFQSFLQERMAARGRLVAERERQAREQRLEEERNQRCSPEYLQDMVEYWEGRGDEAMARIFRTRLALVKGGAL